MYSHSGHLQRGLKTAGVSVDTNSNGIDLVGIKIQLCLPDHSSEEVGRSRTQETLHNALEGSNRAFCILDRKGERGPKISLANYSTTSTSSSGTSETLFNRFQYLAKSFDFSLEFFKRGFDARGGFDEGRDLIDSLGQSCCQGNDGNWIHRIMIVMSGPLRLARSFFLVGNKIFGWMK